MAGRGMVKKLKRSRVRAGWLAGAAALAAASLFTALLAAPAMSAVPSGGPSSPASETYVFVTAWDNAPAPGTFKEPHGIAVDPGGNVIVADTGNHRMQKFTSDGVFITGWGTDGSAPGRFKEPAAVAADSTGSIYVGDLWGGAYEFQKFSASGEFMARWSMLHGYDPLSIAVDGNDNVYVAAHVAYGLVLKYNASGQLITSWQCSSENSAESHGIAVDPHGYVYVADPRNSLIYKFDLDGHFLTSWSHAFESQFASDTQLAADGAGSVYALGERHVVKYSPTGTLLSEWGQFDSPHGVAVGPDGSVYVADTGHNRIQKFTAAGVLVGQWGATSDRSALRHPEGVTVSSDGTVYVADVFADQVMAFTRSGAFLNRWGTMDYPSDIGADSSGNLYVVGPGVPDLGSRTIYGYPYGIRKYTPAGVQLNQWGQCCGSADTQTDWASGIAVSPSGILYVADTNNDRILKLGPDGSLIAKWGNLGSGEGEFNSPEGVALGPDGSVYVSDTLHDRVQKFTADGAFLAVWGRRGDGDGEFYRPKGIAVDGDGYVYVADAFNDRVQKFTSGGVFVTGWGSFGYREGQFDTPLGIAVDSEGFVYVADSYNNRIQKFERASPNLASSAKQVDKHVGQGGDVLTYTITLRNAGRLDAPTVVATDTVPAGTSFNAGSLSVSGGACSESDGLITWTGAVNAGAAVTITYAVTLDIGLTKGVLITNTVTIDDGVVPAFSRSAVTVANPYQVYLPMTIRNGTQ